MKQVSLVQRLAPLLQDWVPLEKSKIHFCRGAPWGSQKIDIFLGLTKLKLCMTPTVYILPCNKDSTASPVYIENTSKWFWIQSRDKLGAREKPYCQPL